MSLTVNYHPPLDTEQQDQLHANHKDKKFEFNVIDKDDIPASLTEGKVNIRVIPSSTPEEKLAKIFRGLVNDPSTKPDILATVSVILVGSDPKVEELKKLYISKEFLEKRRKSNNQFHNFNPVNDCVLWKSVAKSGMHVWVDKISITATRTVKGFGGHPKQEKVAEDRYLLFVAGNMEDVRTHFETFTNASN